MSARNVTVTLDLDAADFTAAARHAAASLNTLTRSLRLSGRAFWRSTLSPGEQHIDRMCREVAGKPNAALRLECAALLAGVIDGRKS